jgi:hypothetical protein
MFYRIDSSIGVGRLSLLNTISALNKALDLQRDLTDSLINKNGWVAAHTKSMDLYHQVQSLMTIEVALRES